MFHEIRLLGDNDFALHERIIYSPEIPRVGESIFITLDGLRYQLVVSEVKYEFSNIGDGFEEKLVCFQVEIEVELACEPWEYKND